MINRWILIPLAVVGLIACTDSTAPESRTVAQRPLTLPEYALQLRGDPFLRSLSQMLGRPQLSEGIDAAVSGGGLSTTANGGAAAAWLTAARTSLVPVFDENAEQSVTERDVLSAALMVTLDRIAELNSGGESTPAESDPPPSR